MMRDAGCPDDTSISSSSATAIASNPTIAAFITVGLSPTRVTAKKIASAAGG